MRRESAQCFLEHDVDEDGNVWGERWIQMPEPMKMILQRKGSQIGCFLIQFSNHKSTSAFG